MADAVRLLSPIADPTQIITWSCRQVFRALVQAPIPTAPRNCSPFAEYPSSSSDNAVRAYYEGRGWAKNYGLPGTSHRTGHSIGTDVHEPPNLMRADRTPLEAGMCFSDEPGIYNPGEFGVRMEDCWHVTEQGPSSSRRSPNQLMQRSEKWRSPDATLP
ncbi:MAG: M24 family metallopeptidase [Woeseiaceae bacterium]